MTDHISDNMVGHFGTENVFQDVDKIPLGADVPTYVGNEISRCDVMLVVIGPTWTQIMQERADEPHDLCRIEIESALQQGKLVIPVLVDRSEMPSPKDLPESVRDLCKRNGAPVRPKPDFKPDCQRIADEIKRSLNLDTDSAAFDRASPKPLSIIDILPPPFEWVEIPGGRVWLEEGGYVPKGGKSYTIAPFRIAKYPITNAQFQVFMEVSDGYFDPQWWAYSEGAKQWHDQNPRPPDTAYPGETHPRTNVNWYEAVAFCLWLSNKVGENITLQMEHQWQRAAIGDNGWTYPWGGRFNSDWCNSCVNGKSQGTTPVTRYPEGASLYGVMDVIGNVWEWCAADWDTGNISLQGDCKRVLRGGSWKFDDSNKLRATFRSRGNASQQYDDGGFRVSAAP